MSSPVEGPASSFVLSGADHTEQGAIVTKGEAPEIGLAISRGRFDKAWSWVDANEDVVAVVPGPRAALLVCADGHGGHPASELAVSHVLEAFGADPPPDVDDREIVRLFWKAGDRIFAEVSGSDRPESRTTLVIALVAKGHLQWASFGDSALFVASASEVRRLDEPQWCFLGDAITPSQVEDAVQHGTEALASDDRVIVATDGFTDFAKPSPEEAIAAALKSGNEAEPHARALVEAAFAGGAGDNVAVAVVAAGLL